MLAGFGSAAVLCALVGNTVPWTIHYYRIVLGKACEGAAAFGWDFQVIAKRRLSDVRLCTLRFNLSTPSCLDVLREGSTNNQARSVT